MERAFRLVNVRRSRTRLRRAAVVGGGLLALASILGLTVSVGPARAASVIDVTTTAQNGSGGCSLSEAIIAANTDSNTHAPECTAGSGADTILLEEGSTFVMSDPYDDLANYTGPTATPMVSSAITIEARGATIQHSGGSAPDDAYRAFAVGLGGNLTIREAYVKGFEVQGGDGGSGGGGGMGAGGAVYVRGGSLTVEQSTFEQNGALGGDGGAAHIVDCLGPNQAVGGGGGGLGGDGGTEFNGCSSAGGGGGSRGDGASGSNISFNQFGGGGAGGTLEDGDGTDGGAQCGGDGGSSFLFPDGDDGCDGGGGGGGASHASSGTVATGDGGTGGYGGGGGGGSGSLFNQGSGGHGGFGGGGGAGSKLYIEGVLVEGDDGGDGGFGGGGGAGECAVLPFCAGAGGTFAGDGASLHGGGGAGLGGAIFGHAATITIKNSTFTGNYANRGHSGGGGANDGRGAGGAIFLVGGSLTVLNATVSGNATGETNASNQGIGGGGIVVYEPTDGTPTSFTLRNTIIAGNGIHECYVRNTPTKVGSGNLIVNGSAPSVSGQTHSACPGIAVTDDPGLASLALNFPGRTPTMAIAAGSSATDKADPATALPIDQRGLVRPAAAPDIGAYEFATPPTTTIALTPATPNGSNGWYKSAVGVSITAVDDGTVAQTRCKLDPAPAPASFADLPDEACALTSVGADGQHAIYAASVDAEGYVEHPPVSVAFKVDRTAPTLAPTLSGQVVLGGSGVTASPNATDPTPGSGVASSSCDAVDASTPGVKSLTCRATDNAGNTGTQTLTYVVEYNIVGFFDPAPGSKWKAGQTVPIKVALGNASGTRISDTQGAALATACRVKFSTTGAQTTSAQCMKYDATNDQFIYSWKLAKTGTGAATIIVTVTYPPSSTTTQRTLTITITS